MSRSTGRPAWSGVILGLFLAVVIGLGLSIWLVSPPADDIRALAVLFTGSGVISVVLGSGLLWIADRFAGISIRTKTFVGAGIGYVVGLVNILMVSQLMFLSTDHDLRILIATVVFSAIVALFFGQWVAATVTGRVETIAATIETLAAGDFAARANVGGRDEIAHLAAYVNELASTLASASEQRDSMDRERRELTTAISHDLRTPLASIRAMTEALDDGVVSSPEEVKRYYASVRREVERLNRMINDLFELAQLDAGALPLNRQPVALDEIAAEVVDSLQPQALQHGINLVLEPGERLPETPLDGARIERAVANLVRNALEHTPPGGAVTVAATRTAAGLEIQVRDTGEGITEDDLPRIWDRFYRAERSRARGPRGADGAGLGLAIVRGIIEAHGGAVTAQSAPGAGSAFTVRLPLTPLPEYHSPA